MATRSGAKLRLFCATSLIAELTCRRWKMIWGSMPGMSDGDHANTRASRSALFSLACQDQGGTSSMSSSGSHPSSG
ncbi:unnamed protein product [Prunus armeniaca]